jgi:hypothetical protein
MSEPAGLVGRFFHIWDDTSIARQGRVVAQIDQTHYLVQFYEWIAGDSSTLHIFTLDQMTIKRIDAERAYGSWQFYESEEHMRFWFEHQAPRQA